MSELYSGAAFLFRAYTQIAYIRIQDELPFLQWANRTLKPKGRDWAHSETWIYTGVDRHGVPPSFRSSAPKMTVPDKPPSAPQWTQKLPGWSELEGYLKGSPGEFRSASPRGFTDFLEAVNHSLSVDPKAGTVVFFVPIGSVDLSNLTQATAVRRFLDMGHANEKALRMMYFIGTGDLGEVAAPLRGHLEVVDDRATVTDTFEYVRQVFSYIGVRPESVEPEKFKPVLAGLTKAQVMLALSQGVVHIISSFGRPELAKKIPEIMPDMILQWRAKMGIPLPSAV